MSSVRYTVNSLGENEIIFRLNFTVGQDEQKKEVSQSIVLKPTTPNYGGKRWWFICSLAKDGRLCNRRVATLHIPPGGIYFGCRSCYDLTYTSCQESHKFDSLFAHIAYETGSTPSAVKRNLS